MLEVVKNRAVHALEKVFGTKYERDMKRIGPIVEEINKHFESYKALSDDELRAFTEKFREELAAGASEDEILPRAFAVVKEACRRHLGKSWDVMGQPMTWDMVPYDVQLVGAIVLHEGRIAEMATGEGKTLVALMPLYLNALGGKGAHLVTVNDYLAQRDREWVGPILEYLGLRLGVIKHDMSPRERREAYAADVTYGTNNEFGFDYLRDNMATQREDQVQHGHHYAIIDEVDNILIDEARTPLIISGPVTQTHQNFTDLKPAVERVVRAQTTLVTRWLQDVEKKLHEDGNLDYEMATNLLRVKRGAPRNRRFVKLMSDNPGLQKLLRRVEFDATRDKRMGEIDEELYFSIEEKNREIDLTDKGREAMAPKDPEMFVLPDLALQIEEIEAREDLDPKARVVEKEKAFRSYAERADRIHSILQLLRSYSLYEKDVDYVVQDGKVIIVDEFTGRLMTGRRWSDGLHQAVEAKEGVTVEGETQTFATITLQNYFRLYDKLAGMTGTAETEATEFYEIYKLDVVKIPTHKPNIRVDHDDVIYRTRREKYNALVEEVKALHEAGRPVLVGTTNVDVSETLSRLMKRQGLKHNVLNAKHHQREAEIVSRAGEFGAITIATNMAGRGTDIKLGNGVLPDPETGEGGAIDYEGHMGLAIVGSERHESRRIDRQLRGRCARQGDPGCTRFFLSLEDDLMRLFGSERIATIMQKLGAKEGEVIEHRWVTRAVGNAQKKVEEQNFAIRKRLLEYDDVMNKQREVVYGIRSRVLRGDSMRDELIEYIEGVAESQVASHVDPSEPVTPEAIKLVAAELEMIFVSPMPVDDLLQAEKVTPDTLVDHFHRLAIEAYERRENDWGEELTRDVERQVILSLIDEKWRDHLYEMDMLKEGIGLRAWGQKDPLLEYKREAYNAFEAMMEGLGEEIVRRFFRITVLSRSPREDDVVPEMPTAARKPVATREAHSAYSAFDPSAAPSAPAPSSPRTAPLEPVRVGKKIGRNDPCPCGSGKKYKKCCGAGK